MSTKNTMRETLLEWTPDILLVAGLGAVCYGVWLIHPASAFIVGGLAVFALGAMLSWKA